MPQRVDPGAVLSKRYRLDALHASGDDGSALWRAHDQSLSRSVAVRLLPRGHPHADAVLEAAAEAGRVSDAHLARVLDARPLVRFLELEVTWNLAHDTCPWLSANR